MRRFPIGICLAVLLGAMGCKPLLDTPPQFLRLKQTENDYAYRATTADGVVLAGRGSAPAVARPRALYMGGGAAQAATVAQSSRTHKPPTGR